MNCPEAPASWLHGVSSPGEAKGPLLSWAVLGSGALETLEAVMGLSWHFANLSFSGARPVPVCVLALTLWLPGNRLCYRNSHSFFQADARLIS